MSEKKPTSGEKNLLNGFNQDEESHRPHNIFTQDKLNNIHSHKKKKVRQTSIRVNADASSMLMSMKNVLRFKNINQILYHLIDLQYDKFTHEQRVEYNAFKTVYEQQKK